MKKFKSPIVSPPNDISLSPSSPDEDDKKLEGFEGDLPHADGLLTNRKTATAEKRKFKPPTVKTPKPQQGGLDTTRAQENQKGNHKLYALGVPETCCDDSLAVNENTKTIVIGSRVVPAPDVGPVVPYIDYHPFDEHSGSNRHNEFPDWNAGKEDELRKNSTEQMDKREKGKRDGSDDSNKSARKPSPPNALTSPSPSSDGRAPPNRQGTPKRDVLERLSTDTGSPTSLVHSAAHGDPRLSHENSGMATPVTDGTGKMKSPEHLDNLDKDINLGSDTSNIPGKTFHHSAMPTAQKDARPSGSSRNGSFKIDVQNYIRHSSDTENSPPPLRSATRGSPRLSREDSEVAQQTIREDSPYKPKSQEMQDMLEGKRLGSTSSYKSDGKMFRNQSTTSSSGQKEARGSINRLGASEKDVKYTRKSSTPSPRHSGENSEYSEGRSISSDDERRGRQKRLHSPPPPVLGGTNPLKLKNLVQNDTDEENQKEDKANNLNPPPPPHQPPSQIPYPPMQGSHDEKRPENQAHTSDLSSSSLTFIGKTEMRSKIKIVAPENSALIENEQAGIGGNSSQDEQAPTKHYYSNEDDKSAQVEERFFSREEIPTPTRGKYAPGETSPFSQGLVQDEIHSPRAERQSPSKEQSFGPRDDAPSPGEGQKSPNPKSNLSSDEGKPPRDKRSFLKNERISFIDSFIGERKFSKRGRFSDEEDTRKGDKSPNKGSLQQSEEPTSYLRSSKEELGWEQGLTKEGQLSQSQEPSRERGTSKEELSRERTSSKEQDFSEVQEPCRKRRSSNEEHMRERRPSNEEHMRERRPSNEEHRRERRSSKEELSVERKPSKDRNLSEVQEYGEDQRTSRERYFSEMEESRAERRLSKEGSNQEDELAKMKRKLPEEENVAFSRKSDKISPDSQDYDRISSSSIGKTFDSNEKGAVTPDQARTTLVTQREGSTSPIKQSTHPHAHKGHQYVDSHVRADDAENACFINSTFDKIHAERLRSDPTCKVKVYKTNQALPPIDESEQVKLEEYGDVETYKYEEKGHRTRSEDDTESSKYSPQTTPIQSQTSHFSEKYLSGKRSSYAETPTPYASFESIVRAKEFYEEPHLPNVKSLSEEPFVSLKDSLSPAGTSLSSGSSKPHKGSKASREVSHVSPENFETPSHTSRRGSKSQEGPKESREVSHVSPENFETRSHTSRRGSKSQEGPKASRELLHVSPENFETPSHTSKRGSKLYMESSRASPEVSESLVQSHHPSRRGSKTKSEEPQTSRGISEKLSHDPTSRRGSKTLQEEYFEPVEPSRGKSEFKLVESPLRERSPIMETSEEAQEDDEDDSSPIETVLNSEPSFENSLNAAHVPQDQFYPFLKPKSGTVFKVWRGPDSIEVRVASPEQISNAITKWKSQRS